MHVWVWVWQIKTYVQVYTYVYIDLYIYVQMFCAVCSYLLAFDCRSSDWLVSLCRQDSAQELTARVTFWDLESNFLVLTREPILQIDNWSDIMRWSGPCVTVYMLSYNHNVARWSALRLKLVRRCWPKVLQQETKYRTVCRSIADLSFNIIYAAEIENLR